MRVDRPEHARDHGVEEGLGELGPLVVDEHADVEQLRLLPDRVVDVLLRELRAQALDALADAVVVEADPLPDGLLRLRPGGVFEALLRLRARGPEARVVPLEALEQHVRDPLRELELGPRVDRVHPREG